MLYREYMLFGEGEFLHDENRWLLSYLSER